MTRFPRWPVAVLVLLCAFPAAGQQGGSSVTANSPSKPAEPFRINPKLYNANANAANELRKALKESSEDHKRLLIVFGATWCYDCHVLEYRLHQEPIRSVIEANYRVVHIDVRRYEKNLDVARKYDTPI